LSALVAIGLTTLLPALLVLSFALAVLIALTTLLTTALLVLVAVLALTTLLLLTLLVRVAIALLAAGLALILVSHVGISSSYWKGINARAKVAFHRQARTISRQPVSSEFAANSRP
jgi:hypothetical protein